MSKFELEKALVDAKAHGFEWARRRDQSEAMAKQAREQLQQAERAALIADNRLGEAYAEISELEKQLAELEKSGDQPPGPDPGSS